eukprot:GSChrysophyteH2.ASY1.ANO1.410.1 assembled CDS
MAPQGDNSLKATVAGQRIPSYQEKGRQCTDSVHRRLEHLVAPHMDSFNYMLDEGLATAVADIPPMYIELKDRRQQALIAAAAAAATLDSSDSTTSPHKANENFYTPREARERGLSYTGNMSITTVITIEGGGIDEPYELRHRTRLGDMPIMVMSNRCRMQNMPPEKLVSYKEEGNEKGGYFICNGIERVIRLLQVPRRNHALAIQRSSFKNRGAAYSDLGVSMRCVRPDQSSITMTLHYLSNGGATMKFTLKKQEFLLPVIVVAKALMAITDKEFFDRVVANDANNTFLTTRIEVLLRDGHSQGMYTQNQARAYLGSLFRGYLPVTDDASDVDAGGVLIERYFFVYCESDHEKLEVLLHMTRKLFSFAQGRCCEDNADALMNHELLLPGHLLTMQLKEKLENIFQNTKLTINRDYNVSKARTTTTGSKIGTFLSTGNITSNTGLDLMQVSGFTIVAERLNIFRYMSHFQSVHRGQFFTTMKTTTVRKLLPESWGFLCPVHTPDGSPCGLLNHLAKECVTVSYPTSSKMPTTPKGQLLLMIHLGMVPAGVGGGDGQGVLSNDSSVPVCLDGLVIGGLRVDKQTGSSGDADTIVNRLRFLKATGGNGNAAHYIDPTLEIAYMPIAAKADHAGVYCYPGLYLFTGPGRMIRPVMNLQTKTVEWIGPMEQPYMEIACLSSDIRAESDTVARSNATTHMELNPTQMLSQIASLTPYSDQNQSPRNMYQCQMGKQTMGTPAHAIKHRNDNKLYRIQNPQAPLVQTQSHRDYCMDEYPQGTNAIVCVIAYTGYDMEDAMIINRSAFQRGFGHGCMCKTVVIDLAEEEKRTVKEDDTLDCSTGLEVTQSLAGESFTDELDMDGLPFEGTQICNGQPICCIASAGRTVSITFRYPRQPVIGDKFSSRHGQKGTLGVLWPQENMPFTESGMSPDILINPHAFPSRMTIGMLIESMAGKAGAMHGHFQDATPFRFHEENRIVDSVGEQLVKSGYNYYGSEPLYSGISGKMMEVNIFIGVVYYQRLRHMVSDKSQVRSTGAVQAITRQPVKGRKKGGGIRLGEMERDALLSHGVAFCLHDRLMNCSDSHLAHVCGTCGGLLEVAALGSNAFKAGVRPIHLPYVYRYLTNELAGMGVKLSLKLSDGQL